MSSIYIAAGLGVFVAVGLSLLFHVKTTLRFERATAPLPKANDMPAERWSKLAEAKIFFGHQSVGYNIVNGIEDVIRNGNPMKLNVVETSSPRDFAGPVFAHSPVGKNRQPTSKIEQFAEIMNSGVGEKVDVAILKFCYIDVTNDSNPREIFDEYKSAISDMERSYPRVKFLHLTAPLKSPPKGAKKTIKGFVKWLLRRPTEIDDNLRREQYNKFIREEYGKTDCLFDLALVESVGPDGLSCYVSRNGRRIPFMAPQYTDDGGHLNELGRRITAEQMLITLSQCTMSE
ncbi:MAG: hypothetical protein JW749_09135 [Sedimentisphaerales bacterium]|nr:hypothetical protein [Sedimentisphaerales bacterium]